VNARGWSLPPLIIFAGKTFQSTWFKNDPRYANWSIVMSQNGWMNDEIGLSWLKEIFEPFTRVRKRGTYRLLILDGHGSHLTPEFDQFAEDHQIISLCMSAHLSHLL
jgi:hypothetical protein